MGTLYVVGTPIGNLEDITRRAARVLGEVDLIASEDTRVTRRLLNHLGLKATLTSYHQHNWQARITKLLNALQDGDVALVTDAGMPTVSDPGAALVARAAAAGFPVEVVPGASAVTAALAVSGVEAGSFLFLGFLPRRRKQRREVLHDSTGLSWPLVIFEAPHRVLDTLADMLKELGDRELSVCRELTKLHEEVFRGTISQAMEHFSSPLGEFVLVVRGVEVIEAEQGSLDSDLSAARIQLDAMRQAGAKAKDAVSLVAESQGLPKNVVYRLWLDTRV